MIPPNPEAPGIARSRAAQDFAKARAGDQALASAQTAHARAVKLKAIARREPAVRDLLAERDSLAARVAELEAQLLAGKQTAEGDKPKA